jgi:transcriptional regulator with PAS, ATPase and Fis domain
MQGKLLRVLQERRVCPVGSLSEERVEARVIAATNRNLLAEVKAGRFREDLYYRLTTLTVEVPPLRQRREDIPRLFTGFLSQKTSQHEELKRFWRSASQYPPPVPMSFFERLLAFGWPGNIRHLRNIVEKVAVGNVKSPRFVEPEELVAEASEQTADPAPAGAGALAGPGEQRTPERPSEEVLLELLERHDYVQRRAAKEIGVSHTTLDRWMQELGLRRPRDIPMEELQAAVQEAGGDLAATAKKLRVSRRGLQLRLTALGMNGN